MSKYSLGAAMTASVLAAAALVPAEPAFATSDKAAAVIKDEGCTGFIPTADGGIGPLITTTKGHRRITTSSGVGIVSCHFKIPRESAPSRPLSAKGFDCGVGGTLTTDTSMLVVPGGRALLVCKLKG